MRALVEYTFTKDYGRYKKGDTIKCHPSTKKLFEDRLKVEEKPKRVRRTKEQIEAENKKE